MFESSIVDEAFQKFSKGMDFVMLIKFILTELDLALNIVSSIFCFFLAVEVVTDSGVAFNADNCTPVTCSVLIRTFLK